jgi:hypothetical protein
VTAGHVGSNDYRGEFAPTAIRIFQHKTNAVVLHPRLRKTTVFRSSRTPRLCLQSPAPWRPDDPPQNAGKIEKGKTG